MRKLFMILFMLMLCGCNYGIDANRLNQHYRLLTARFGYDVELLESQGGVGIVPYTYWLIHHSNTVFNIRVSDRSSGAGYKVIHVYFGKIVSPMEDILESQRIIDCKGK